MPTAPPPALDRAAEDALYPCSDGEPMAEDMWQSWAMMTAAGDLGVALPEALVALDILMYPEEGNPNNRISPDVLVALGLGTHNRMSYLVWREGKPPDWVLEVASPSTVGHELDAKRHIYAAIGVPEYWQFYPRGDLFPRSAPQLLGLTLANGEYQPLPARFVDGVQTIRSPTLGLDLRAEGKLIRFRDPVTGEDVRHQDEAEAAARREAARAEREAARARQATERAEREAARARQATERAEQEAARAQRATADLAAAQTRIAELEAAALRARGPAE